MKSRIKIIIACSLAALIMGLLFCTYGYDRTWTLWNIPTMSPHFADLRGFLAGAESRALGFDPMINNPADPYTPKRQVNYPRVLQGLYGTGVNQNHTTFIGMVLILFFLVGVCLILPYADYKIIATVMAAVLSPAVLLGIERTNIDLLMFFLVSLAIITVKRQPVFSVAAVLLAFVLKLFPIFGGAALLRVGRSMFPRYIFIIVLCAAFYTALTYSDLLLIKAATPQSTLLTYGLNVVWMKIAGINATLGTAVKYLSYLMALLLLLYASTALLRDDFLDEGKSPSVYLDAFRAGAAIYLGTFLLNNNWDHRLMFLIFTLPQLVSWIHHSARLISINCIIVLLSTLLSMWYLMIAKSVEDVPFGLSAIYALDKIFHWIIFGGLLYLFFWSLPDWMKEYARKIRHFISGKKISKALNKIEFN